MDYEQDFMTTARETVATLISKSVPKATFTSSDGQTILGWQFDGIERNIEIRGNPGRGWWQETWGRTAYVIDSDCRFWEYSFSGVDEHERDSRLSHGIRPMPKNYLVGSEGEPFSKYKAILQRLQYQY